jgi:hypothetical protein
MLPDGLSDIELCHSNLPIDNILGCKTALTRTALAYQTERKHLKALIPIREYMQKTHQPTNYLIQPLMKYFHRLLEVYWEFNGTQIGSQTVAQISSNMANIQTLLQNGLQPDHPDLKDTILCALALNSFSRLTGQGSISFLGKLHHILPYPCDHRLEAALIAELFASYLYFPISNPETLMAQGLEHFEHFEDSDLKCRLSAYPWSMKTDISCKVNCTWIVHSIIYHMVPTFQLL